MCIFFACFVELEMLILKLHILITVLFKLAFSYFSQTETAPRFVFCI